MLTIRENLKPFSSQNSSPAGADHDVKKKKNKKRKIISSKENKPEMQARATLAPLTYFCVEVVRKLFTDKPLKHCPEKKLKKKKEKRERKRCLKLPGVRGGFWQSSAEKWEG